MGTFSIRTQTFRLEWADYLAMRLSALSLALTTFPSVLAVAGVFIGIPLLIDLPDLLKGKPMVYFCAQATLLGLSIAAGTADLFKLHRLYRREPMMHGERLMILDDGAVRLTGQGYDIRQSWAAFSRVRHSRHHIFLLMPHGRVHALPKRALATPQAAVRLLTLARAATQAARETRLALPPLPETPDNRERWQSLPYGREGGTLGFTRDHVRYTAPTIACRIDWSNIRAVSLVLGKFVLRSPEGRFVVPTSAFATPAQAMAFYTQAVAFWRAAEARREFHS